MSMFIRDGGRFLALEWFGRPSRPRSLHVWFGPLGFHFFGKPIVEWFPEWRGPNTGRSPE